MKKIAILTWCYEVGPVNYGQVLQCYALQRVIEKMGAEAKVLKFRRLTDEESICDIQAVGNRFQYEKQYKNKQVEDQEKPDVKKFWDFIGRNIKLSNMCYTEEELKDEIRDVDAVVLGSDQLWNPLWFDSVNLLGFAKEKRRLTYATGGIDVRNKKSNQIYKQIADGIADFNRISVREKKSAQILEEYTKREISTVLDPTLLLGTDDWDSICINSGDNKKYIFCYCLGSVQPHKHLIKAIAHKYGIEKVLYIKKDWFDQNFNEEGMFEAICDAGPEDFVSYIKNAKCIITDSFHGCCFSIIYGKIFYSLKRAYESSDMAATSRMDNLFESLEMEKRWVSFKKDIEEMDIIDYFKVQSKLEKLRHESILYLDGGIS